MAIKAFRLAPRGQSEYRNPLVSFVDPKTIDIERTMVNLFELLRHKGNRAASRLGTISIDRLLEKQFPELANAGTVKGFTGNEEAVRWWLRSNLVDFVKRGKGPEEEVFASLRPIHIKSSLIRNAKNLKDYYASEQLYNFLSVDIQVREMLTTFASEGWQDGTVTKKTDLDIDSLGILRLVEGISDVPVPEKNNPYHAIISPFFKNSAKAYCDDIHALLRYQKDVPRHVLLEYIRTISAFHLALYHIQLFVNLPKIAQFDPQELDNKVPLVVDITDNPDSTIANLAMQSAQTVLDSVMDYMRMVFKINIAIRYLRLDYSNDKHLLQAIELLRNPDDKFQAYCQAQTDQSVSFDSIQDEDDFADMIELYDTNLDQYAETMAFTRGKSQYSFLVRMFDSFTLKNIESGCLAAGKSRRHKRRFVLGSKLLETLIQISVLRQDGADYHTEPVSIEDFMKWLEERYGLIINGINNPNFPQDISTNKAFLENIQKFKDKLRQIGYYNVLSDAFILQKIRPRYDLTHPKNKV
jgi:hypothetical protein